MILSQENQVASAFLHGTTCQFERCALPFIADESSVGIRCRDIVNALNLRIVSDDYVEVWCILLVLN